MCIGRHNVLHISHDWWNEMYYYELKYIKQKLRTIWSKLNLCRCQQNLTITNGFPLWAKCYNYSPRASDERNNQQNTKYKIMDSFVYGRLKITLWLDILLWKSNVVCKKRRMQIPSFEVNFVTFISNRIIISIVKTWMMGINVFWRLVYTIHSFLKILHSILNFNVLKWFQIVY